MAKEKGFDLTRVRNLGVIAHIDAGKTTTTEHLLFYAGVKHKLGGVDEGTTETDFDPEEQARGITIYSACVPFEWANHTINLIDTPGHVDFSYEVSRSLAACEGAILLVDAAQGIEAQTLANLYLALENDLTIIPVLNKIDLPAAQPEKYANELARIIKIMVGHDINPGSTQQLARYFHEEMDYPVVGKTDSGAPAVDETAMYKILLKTKSPVASVALAYKRAAKVGSMLGFKHYEPNNRR